MSGRSEPGYLPTPVMSHQMKLLRAQRIGHGQHITDKKFNVVVRQRMRSCAGRITTLIRSYSMEASSSQDWQLMSPGMVGLGKAMQQQDQRLATYASFFDVVRPRTDL